MILGYNTSAACSSSSSLRPAQSIFPFFACVSNAIKCNLDEFWGLNSLLPVALPRSLCHVEARGVLCPLFLHSGHEPFWKQSIDC